MMAKNLINLKEKRVKINQLIDEELNKQARILEMLSHEIIKSGIGFECPDTMSSLYWCKEATFYQRKLLITCKHLTKFNKKIKSILEKNPNIDLDNLSELNKLIKSQVEEHLTSVSRDISEYRPLGIIILDFIKSALNLLMYVATLTMYPGYFNPSTRVIEEAKVMSHKIDNLVSKLATTNEEIKLEEKQLSSLTQ